MATKFKDQFKKIKLLGEGAFGAAYLVLKRGESAQCVCKEVRITHLTDKEKEGALGESHVLRSISHPNIVAYVDTFMDTGKLYIVMEYADGGDLACKVRDRKENQRNFSQERVMLTFVQIAKALQHIHSRKILHRDLKPMNIFLTKAGIIKLGDFGIARVLESSTAGAQTTIGTPFYLSPEQCNNEQYNFKSDLWSLGVVMYEMAALKVPFHAPSLPAVAMMICNAEFAPLPKMYCEIIVSIVTRLLDKDPVKRPGLEDLFQEDEIRMYVDWYHDIMEEHGFNGRPQNGGLTTPDDAARQNRGHAVLQTPDEGNFHASVDSPWAAKQAARGGRGNVSSDDYAQRSRDEYFANRRQVEETRRRAKGFEHTPRGGPGDDEMLTFGNVNHEESRPRERTHTREEQALRERALAAREEQRQAQERERAELDKAHQQALENRRFAQQRKLEASAEDLGYSKAAQRRSQFGMEDQLTFAPEPRDERKTSKESSDGALLVVSMAEMAGESDKKREKEKSAEKERLALLEKARRENVEERKRLMEKHGRRSTIDGEKFEPIEEEEPSTAAPSESDGLLVFDFRSPGGRDRGSPASSTSATPASGSTRHDRNVKGEQRAPARHGDVSEVADGRSRWKPEIWPYPADDDPKEDKPKGERKSVTSSTSRKSVEMNRRVEPKPSREKTDGKKVEIDPERERILEERRREKEEARQEFYRQKKAAEAAKRKSGTSQIAPPPRTRENRIEFSGVDIKQISHEDDDQFYAAPSPKDEGWYVIHEGLPDTCKSEQSRSRSVPAFGFDPEEEPSSASQSHPSRSRSAPNVRSQVSPDVDEDEEGLHDSQGSFTQAGSREQQRTGLAASCEDLGAGRRSNPLIMRRQIQEVGDPEIDIADASRGGASASSSGAENSRKSNPLLKNRKHSDTEEDLSHTQRARNLAGQLFSPSSELLSPSDPAQGQNFKLPNSSPQRRTRESTSDAIAAVREAMRAVSANESEGVSPEKSACEDPIGQILDCAAAMEKEGVFSADCQLRLATGAVPHENIDSDDEEVEVARIYDDEWLVEEGGEEEDDEEGDSEVTASQTASPQRSSLLDVDECY